MDKMVSTRKVTLSAILIALTVILSPIYFPVGATKCQPFQHMVNVLTGIILGPWYAVFVALVTGIIRNNFGLGTIYAFPGGIPGGLIVGLVYRYLKETDYAALTEPLGTVVIGATLSAMVVAPWQGHSMSLAVFWIAFATSSIPGCLIGFLILKALRRSGFVELFF
jgi:energy coupling factor transporter S component ThiW